MRKQGDTSNSFNNQDTFLKEAATCLEGLMLRVCMDCLMAPQQIPGGTRLEAGGDWQAPAGSWEQIPSPRGRRSLPRVQGTQMLLTCESGDRNVLADSVNRVFILPCRSPWFIAQSVEGKANCDPLQV